MDTAGGRAVSHHTDQPQRRAFSQSLKSGSCPCRNVLGPVNVTLYRITPTSHMWSDYLHFKTSNGTVFGGGEKRAVDGDEREEAGNEGKERCSFDSFTSHSRHAWLICLFFFLFTPPIPLCWHDVAVLLIPARFSSSQPSPLPSQRDI